MIEMRWLIIDTEDAAYNGFANKPAPERVLQYRQQTNMDEWGLQEPIWSDWIDVPEVKEVSSE